MRRTTSKQYIGLRDKCTLVCYLDLVETSWILTLSEIKHVRVVLHRLLRRRYTSLFGQSPLLIALYTHSIKPCLLLCFFVISLPSHSPVLNSPCDRQRLILPDPYTCSIHQSLFI